MFQFKINLYTSFFLDNGADPNMPDKFGIYPLQQAIKNDSLMLVDVLIGSNKIDYKKRIPLSTEDDKNEAKETTYLHLAAAQINPVILQDLLNTNEFNVNVTNDIGETPLMIACKCKNINNIKRLFLQNDLDYLHQDNLGRDALEIISPSNDKEQNVALSKDEYKSLLIEELTSQKTNKKVAEKQPKKIDQQSNSQSSISSNDEDSSKQVNKSTDSNKKDESNESAKSETDIPESGTLGNLNKTTKSSFSFGSSNLDDTSQPES